MRTPQQIAELFEQRRRYYTTMHAGMKELAAIYRGEAMVNLPDMGRDEQASVPNLLAQGVDQMAGRIASVTPQVIFVPEKANDRAAERRARTASDVVNAWWFTDNHQIKRMERARNLVTFAMTPAVVRWDGHTFSPTWEVRDPRTAYPSLDVIPGTVLPTDVMFAYERTAGWMVANGYQDALAAVVGRNRTIDPHGAVQIVEYVDSEQRTVIAVGYAEKRATEALVAPSGQVVALMAHMPTNGIMTASCPSRIALGKIGGQFDSMTGMYYAQAKLMALELLAIEKDIFPDTWIESYQGEQAQILDGPHDGRTGLINHLTGGRITTLQSSPGYMTNQSIDRLERSQRVTAGIPSDFGGESGTNIRTGRRGDAVLSAVIDFPLAEAQNLLAATLRDENRAAIELAKRYDGENTRTLYVGTGKPITYTADQVFKHSEHVVVYPVSGTDINTFLVGLGQRVGMGTLSKRSAAEKDPFIDDPELEHDRTVAEALEQSLLAGIQQRAAAPPEAGGIPPLILARVMTLVKSDKLELAEALQKATEEAIEAQAEAQAQQQEAMGGEAPMPTVEQAAAPGAASLTGSPIPGPSQGQRDLASLLASTRLPLMGVRNRVGTTEGGRVAV